MSEETYIVRHRDIAEIIQLQDASALEQFMEAPLPVIAEILTGSFALGFKGAGTAGLRIAQGAIKGRLFQQVAQEIKDLRRLGAIPGDFAEKKYGYQSWVELFEVIDSDIPDEERLEALKAMFFAINHVGTNDGDRIVGYQLFQVSKQLTAGELLTLKAAYELQTPNTESYEEWCRTVSATLGRSLQSLIMLHEQRLQKSGLVALSHGQMIATNRITHLGRHFCENLERYQVTKKKMQSE